MIGVILGRRGERIVLAEYPADFLDRTNDRIDAIAAEADEHAEACS